MYYIDLMPSAYIVHSSIVCCSHNSMFSLFLHSFQHKYLPLFVKDFENNLIQLVEQLVFSLRLCSLGLLLLLQFNRFMWPIALETIV